MATPKRKTSHARTAQRKAHWLGALDAPSTMTCPHCGDMTLSYRACPSCGFYKSRQAIQVKSEA